MEIKPPFKWENQGTTKKKAQQKLLFRNQEPHQQLETIHFWNVIQ